MSIIWGKEDTEPGEEKAYQQGKNRREGDDINADIEPP